VSHLRPVVWWKAIELRHRIAALSATELVARAPDRWKRAALDLALGEVGNEGSLWFPSFTRLCSEWVTSMMRRSFGVRISCPRVGSSTPA
jgi:hypothetical protein